MPSINRHDKPQILILAWAQLVMSSFNKVDVKYWMLGRGFGPNLWCKSPSSVNMHIGLTLKAYGYGLENKESVAPVHAKKTLRSEYAGIKNHLRNSVSQKDPQIRKLGLICKHQAAFEGNKCCLMIIDVKFCQASPKFWMFQNVPYQTFSSDLGLPKLQITTTK